MKDILNSVTREYNNYYLINRVLLIVIYRNIIILLYLINTKINFITKN